MLKTIVDEPNIEVKKHILQLIAVLAKHELMRGNWNELFAFIESCIKSHNVNKREVKNILKLNPCTYFKLIIILIYSLVHL